MVLILFQVAPWAFASMGDHAFVGARHGHPLQYKDTEISGVGKPLMGELLKRRCKQQGLRHSLISY